MTILYPWKMIGRYSNGEEIIVCGNDEEDCMGKLIDRIEDNKTLEWYSGISDEDYVGGEYIGAENFIY